MKINPVSRCSYGMAVRARIFGARQICCGAVAMAVVFSLSGCMTSSSLSESSNSLSTSFNSSSKSSKSSSEERKEAYLDDISHYTAAYARSNSDITGLTRGLATVSEKHGVTNWEADNTSYVGIGSGFARANLPPQQLDAYMTGLAQGSRHKMAALQQGFSKAR